MLVRRAVWLLMTAAGIAACADSSTTGPDKQATLGIWPGPGSGGPDTSRTPPSAVRVHGRVLAVSVSGPAAGTGDTLHFEPVAGATVRVYRNVLVADSVASEELVAQTTTSATGEYHFAGIPGGYYIVRAALPANSPYADNWAYLAATAADVKVDVYVWRKP